MSNENENATEGEGTPQVATHPTRITSLITVEVPIFLLIFSTAISGSVVSNLLLFRTCELIFNHNETECALLGTHNTSQEIKDLESEVQPYASLVFMVRSLVEGIFPAILSFLLGPWSDKYGRKPVIVAGMLGATLSSLLTVAYSAATTLNPWWFILTVIPFSMSGGMCACFTGTLSYITDITKEDNRSFRLTILEAGVLVGLLLGTIASPYTFNVIGYTNTFIITAVCNALAFLYSIFCFKESVNVVKDGNYLKVLELSLIKDMIKTCCKKRDNYGRMLIFLLMSSNAIGIFVMYGTMNIDYMYVREKVSWTLEDYSIFNAYAIILSVVGLFIGVSILQKLLKVSDALLGSLSYLSALIECVIRAFAMKTWHLYLGTTIGMARSLSSPLLRSMMSKLVPPEDVGKVYSLMSTFVGVIPILSSLLFNMIYKETLKSFEGATYMVAAGFYSLCFLLQLAVLFIMFKHPRQPYSLVINED